MGNGEFFFSCLYGLRYTQRPLEIKSLKQGSEISPWGRQLFLQVYCVYMTMMILTNSRVPAMCLWQNNTTEKSPPWELVLCLAERSSASSIQALSGVICSPRLPPSGMRESNSCSEHLAARSQLPGTSDHHLTEVQVEEARGGGTSFAVL